MAGRWWREEAVLPSRAFYTPLLSALVISTLVYFLRFALLLGVEVALFHWVAWNTCRPLADLRKEGTFGGAIPPEATCYTRDHGIIAFHDFRPYAEDPIPVILTAGLLFCFLACFFWRGFWIGGKRASKPSAGAAQAGDLDSTTGRDETKGDPFAASKATTLSQLATVFWQRFGPGPVVLACMLVAFSLATITPPFASYQGLVPLAVIAAGGALLLGRPYARKKRSGNPTSQ